MMIGSKLLLLLERFFVPREGNFLPQLPAPRVRFLSLSEVVLLCCRLGLLLLSRCHHVNLVHAVMQPLQDKLMRGMSIMLDVDEQNGQTNRSHAQQVVEEDDLGAGCSAYKNVLSYALLSQKCRESNLRTFWKTKLEFHSYFC